MHYAEDAASMLDALARTPGWDRVKGEMLDDETVGAVLDEAAKFAEGVIAPTNAVGDREGARHVDGHVQVPAAFRQTWAAFGAAGWLGLELDEDLGGQGLPLSLFVGTAHLFDRANAALMMVSTSTRAAALLINGWGDEATKADWVPALAAGERTATICISEPEAGSDVGRIRTRAEQGADGVWRVSGQKIWISFGDHDMVDRHAHCLLARTNDAPGTRGLSLFLVERGAEVICERIEEKLGLHGSPTCALRFDGAPAVLLGEEGRGLAQMFTMIRHMRLSVACQGLGLSLEALHVAESHAAERRQGGSPKAPAVPIISHADVQRQIMEIRSRADLLRLALAQTAVFADLSADDPEAARLCAWMLPLIKSFGAEAAFENASRAIQVLGGSGYTKDYSAEQALRDARVFAIYEGTTGMQGQDFTLRQSLAEGGAALTAFLSRARAECGGLPDRLAVIDAFADFALPLVEDPDRGRVTAMADAFMRAGWVAVQAWLSARIPDSESARFFMATAREQLALHMAAARR